MFIRTPLTLGFSYISEPASHNFIYLCVNGVELMIADPSISHINTIYLVLIESLKITYLVHVSFVLGILNQRLMLYFTDETSKL